MTRHIDVRKTIERWITSMAQVCHTRVAVDNGLGHGEKERECESESFNFQAIMTSRALSCAARRSECIPAAGRKTSADLSLACEG